MPNEELADFERFCGGSGDTHFFRHDASAVSAGVTEKLEPCVAEDDPIELGTHALANDLTGQSEVEAVLSGFGQDGDHLVGDEVLHLVDDQPDGPSIGGRLRPVEGYGEHHANHETADSGHGLGTELTGGATENDALAAIEGLLEVDGAPRLSQEGSECSGVEETLDLGRDRSSGRCKPTLVEGVPEEVAMSTVRRP